MKIKLNDSRIKTIQQVKEFINSIEILDFKVESRFESYPWVEEVLVKFGYTKINRKDKGYVRKYIKALTGYSQSQITRFVSKYEKTGRVRAKEPNRNKFKKIYTEEDIKILAKTDEFHNNPSGQMIKAILTRQYNVFGLKEYKNISNISVAHIYNLRKTKKYLKINKSYEKTKPTIVSIAERQRPQTNGEPGYLRVDTVHQGDRDGEKGVYHVNTVDEITQFEMIGATEKISERYMVPLLEKLIEAYPFKIKGFHSDNGSEYINHNVERILNNLLVKFTKSRSRRSNDNGLVESKNGAVIRKHIGYGYIDQKWADEINIFYFDYFNNYLNYHRPCAFVVKEVDSKGRIRKKYPLESYKTPYEALKELDTSEQYLKEKTFKELDKIAYKYNDNEYAKIMRNEKIKLLEAINLPDLTENII